MPCWATQVITVSTPGQVPRRPPPALTRREKSKVPHYELHRGRGPNFGVYLVAVHIPVRCPLSGGATHPGGKPCVSYALRVARRRSHATRRTVWEEAVPFRAADPLRVGPGSLDVGR